MKIHYKVLISCLVVVFLTAFIGSLFTSGNTNSEWYINNKPSITPPNYVFPVVWNILFFLIALSLYFAWIKAKKTDKNKIIFAYGINLLLNALWSLLFFRLQQPFWAFADLLLILATIILMIYVAYPVDRKSAYLLVPYLLWVSFAGVLNLLWIF